MNPAIVPELYMPAGSVSTQNVSRPVREMTEAMHSTAVFRTGEERDMPHMSYDPRPPPDGEPSLPPQLEVRHIGNAPLLRTLSGIHDLQQENMRRQEHRRPAKGHGRGSGYPQQPPPHLQKSFVVYDGTDNQCSICPARVNAFGDGLSADMQPHIPPGLL